MTSPVPAFKDPVRVIELALTEIWLLLAAVDTVTPPLTESAPVPFVANVIAPVLLVRLKGKVIPPFAALVIRFIGPATEIARVAIAIELLFVTVKELNVVAGP